MPLVTNCDVGGKKACDWLMDNVNKEAMCILANE